MPEGPYVILSLYDLEKAINRLNLRKGFEHVHNLHLKYRKTSFQNLLYNVLNKFMIHITKVTQIVLMLIFF